MRLRKDLKILKLLGITAYYLNQNMHLPEHVFCPVSVNDVKYDAIYIAQAKKFKRLFLASYIKKLYVLTYQCKNKTREGANDLHAFEPLISHCHFNRDFVYDENEICKLISESHCGLALSKKDQNYTL